MKWTFIVSILFFFAFFFVSCKKDNPVPGSSADLPRTIAEEEFSSSPGHLTDSSLLTYDGSSRLTGIISVTTPGSKIIYQYQADHTATRDVYRGDQVVVHTDIRIGENGFADSSFQYSTGYDTLTFKYIYNASNQLIERREYLYNSLAGPGSFFYDRERYSYDGNENMTRNENLSQATTYDYYTGMLNPFSLEPFIPRAKNLVKTETGQLNGRSSTVTHTYKFDDKQRLIEDAAVYAEGTSIVKRYTY